MKKHLLCTQLDLFANGDLKSLALAGSAAIDVVEAKEGEAPKRPTFNIEAYNGGALRVGGYYRPVVIDLAGLRANRVAILLDHNPAQIVGQGTAEILGQERDCEGDRDRRRLGQGRARRQGRFARQGGLRLGRVGWCGGGEHRIRGRRREGDRERAGVRRPARSGAQGAFWARFRSWRSARTRRQRQR